MSILLNGSCLCVTLFQCGVDIAHLLPQELNRVCPGSRGRGSKMSGKQTAAWILCLHIVRCAHRHVSACCHVHTHTHCPLFTTSSGPRSPYLYTSYSHRPCFGINPLCHSTALLSLCIAGHTPSKFLPPFLNPATNLSQPHSLSSLFISATDLPQPHSLTPFLVPDATLPQPHFLLPFHVPTPFPASVPNCSLIY